MFLHWCTAHIVGSIATVIGPGVKDPIIRTINTEVPAIAFHLILLTYNHTVALLTYIAASLIIMMILLRAVVDWKNWRQMYEVRPSMEFTCYS